MRRGRADARSPAGAVASLQTFEAAVAAAVFVLAGEGALEIEREADRFAPRVSLFEERVGEHSQDRGISGAIEERSEVRFEVRFHFVRPSP